MNAPLTILLSAALLSAQDASDDWTQEALEEVSAAVQEQVATLRGAEFAGPVRVEIANKAGLIEYAVKRMEEMQLPGAMENASWTARLLGLLPHDADLEKLTMKVLEEQVERVRLA